jgi:hypothetical protein
MSTSSSATGVSCIMSPSMVHLPTESLHQLAHPVTVDMLRETKKRHLV